MQIIDKMKDNYRIAKEKELEAKKLRDADKARKNLTLTDEDIKEIGKLIGEVNPVWGKLEPEILELFLKLAIKQYKPKEDEFDLTNKDAIRKKIVDIFHTSDKITFAAGGKAFRPDAITEAQILQLNATYLRGKSMGNKFKKLLKLEFEKQSKNI